MCVFQSNTIRYAIHSATRAFWHHMFRVSTVPKSGAANYRRTVILCYLFLVASFFCCCCFVISLCRCLMEFHRCITHCLVCLSLACGSVFRFLFIPSTKTNLTNYMYQKYFWMTHDDVRPHFFVLLLLLFLRTLFTQ